MKIEVTKSMFRDEFQRTGRGEQFSYEGLGALYDYLEGVDPDMELDVVGLCCDFTEYGDLEEIAEDYDMPEGDDTSRLEWLESQTMVIEYDGGLIIQDF